MTESDDGPVGWYLHPEDPKLHRYWDGKTWAEYFNTPSPAVADSD